MHLKSIDRVVFWVSISIISFFVALGFFFPTRLETIAGVALKFSILKFGWFYLISTFLFLIFCIYLIFGPYGKIRLGKDDEKPKYSYFSWLAMLFSAGMGIGLVFYGVAEPMSHFSNPPMGLADPESKKAVKLAFRYAFFHWGLHPWAIYSLISLAMAYFQFRKDETGLISNTLKPLWGKKMSGPLGKLIDITAIIATAFGVATSLGLGSLQIKSGLKFTFGIELTPYIIIGITTVLFLISATTGLDKGIKILSNTNLSLAFFLFIFVLFVGPTNFIMELFTDTVGNYLQNFIPMSFKMTPIVKNNIILSGEKLTGQNYWLIDNTLFFWAWWIAWSPFVGTFIARVSRGRTIKEFVVTVMLVPTLIGSLWFSALGGTAMYEELFAAGKIVDAVAANKATAIFVTLERLPWGLFLCFIATTLVIVFFVTSADSATFVLGMLSSRGILNPENTVKIIWGLLQAGIAITLLNSGGLHALQTAVIVTALPFSFVLMIMLISLNKSLKEDLQEHKKKLYKP